MLVQIAKDNVSASQWCRQSLGDGGVPRSPSGIQCSRDPLDIAALACGVACRLGNDYPESFSDKGSNAGHSASSADG